MYRLLIILSFVGLSAFGQHGLRPIWTNDTLNIIDNTRTDTFQIIIDTTIVYLKADSLILVNSPYLTTSGTIDSATAAYYAHESRGDFSIPQDLTVEDSIIVNTDGDGFIYSGYDLHIGASSYIYLDQTVEGRGDTLDFGSDLILNDNDIREVNKLTVDTVQAGYIQGSSLQGTLDQGGTATGIDTLRIEGTEEMYLYCDSGISMQSTYASIYIDRTDVSNFTDNFIFITADSTYITGKLTFDAPDTFEIEPSSVGYTDINSTNPIYINAPIEFKGDSIRADSATIEGEQQEYNVYYNPTTGRIEAHEINHGYFAFEDSAHTISLSSSSTWYQVTNTAKTLWDTYENAGVTIADDTITIAHTGHYQIHYHLVGQGGNGIYYNLRLWNVTQGEAIPIKTAATATGANNISIGNTAYCTNCNAGDKIIMHINAETNTQTWKAIDGSILIIMTHGE